MSLDKFVFRPDQPALDEPVGVQEARVEPILDFKAPVVDFGFHSRSEKPIDPTAARGSVWGAAFRQDNMIGAFMSRKDMGIDNSKEDGYPSAWSDISGTKYEPYWDRFVDSNNRRYTDGIKRQIDMERDDNRTLDAAGWYGDIARMGAGTADVTTLLPGGSMVKAVKGGYLVSRSALMVGAAAGVGTAVQEGILQSQQQTRSWEDSAIAVGGSVILGAVLGSAGAALLNKAERKTADSAMRVLHGADDAVGAVASTTGKVTAGALAGTPGAVGAAAVEKPTREALGVEGRGAQAVVDTLGGLTPNTRLMTSPSAAARRYGDELAETVVYRNMHADGDTVGPAVETLARVNYNARIRTSVAEHKDLFKAGRKAGFGMTKVEFEEAIGRALRNGDVGDNEFVTKGAQAWRKNLFDPFKEEAIAARLLPPDVTPEGAVSYFSRVYDRQRLIANEADFKGRITNYFSPLLEREFAKHAETTRARIAALEAESADLRLDADQRTTALADINAVLRDLEAKNIDKIDLVDRITTLSRAAREATDKGDRATAKAAREEIARLKADGGKDLSGFIKERGALRSRANRVNMNYAGLAERQNKIMDQLADLEESNIRNMNRLVARGRKFEQDAQRLDPLIRDEKMAELRTAFGQVLQRSEKAAQRIADARAKLAEDAAKGGTNGRKTAANSTGVQQPAGRVSEAAGGDQGGVRADPRVGTAVPTARFGQEGSFGQKAISAEISAPAIKADLGVDIPGTLLRELRGEPASVTAFHGSPHEFDRFSLDKIGTGEGAQAYGYGLYFAENEGIAKGYRDRLAKRDNYGEEAFIDGQPLNLFDPRHQAAGAIFDHNGDRAKAADDIRQTVKRWKGDPDAEERIQVWEEALRLLETGEKLPEANFGGRMYEVRINADPERFLDWDKPLSGQSEAVQKALGYHSRPRNLEAEAKVKPGTPEYAALEREMDTRVGSPGVPDVTGAEYYRSDILLDNAGAEKDMSVRLREAGIPGIKYLDAGSRNNAGWKIMPPEETVSGKYVVSQFGGANASKFDTEAEARAFLQKQEASASRNFVVFDDSLIQIIGKDGKPVPLNEVMRGEAVGRLSVTADLRADLMPPTGMTSDAASIMRAAMDGKPKTIAELEDAVAAAANDLAPDGVRVKQSTLDAFNEAIRDNATGTLAGGKPLSLSQFIARNGGLAIDGDAIAGGLNKFRVPGYGNVARKTGRSIDGYWREALMEAGYFPKDADGYMSRNITDELYAALEAERTGTKRYSIYDQDRVAAMQEKAKAADAKQELEYRAEQNAKVITDDLAAVGIEAKQIDMEALNRVAIKMAEGDATDPLELYERAVVALADEVDATAVKAADDKLAKDMAKGPRAVRAPSPESIALRQQALDVQLAREEKLEKARIEKLNGLARRMETLDAFNPEERMFELRRIMDELARAVSDSSLAKGEKAVALKDRYKQFNPERVEAREAEIARMKAEAQSNFNERWRAKEDSGFVDLNDPTGVNFKAYAQQIADEVYDKIMGKDHAGVAAADFITPLKSGPLKERTFNVPDKLIEDFLDSNVMSVGDRYGRSMSAQIEMSRRFGRADMQDQLNEIADEFRAMREAVQQAGTAEEAYAIVGKDPSMLDGLRAWLRGAPEQQVSKERLLQYLHDAEKANKEDLAAMRDLILGRYNLAENAGDYARMVRNAMSFNYIRVMGGSGVINAISEVYRPAMVHGLSRFMADGIAPLIKNLDAVKMAVHEAQLAGQVVDVVNANRLMSWAEIGDPFKANTAVERMLKNGTDFASKWNGLVYWTDAIKSISSVISMNRIIDGVLGKSEDIRFLGMLGISTKNGMAGRIAEQFQQFGKTVDGVKIANTEAWTDVEAVRTFRAALSKDVDSIIVTRSVGDVPLLANTPTGKAILQFRTFNIAAMQRVMMRGLQEEKAKFLTSVVAMSSLGMMAATFRSWRGGEERWEKFKKSAQNPGYLISEGLDNSGIFTVPFEIANTAEKFLQGGGIDFNPLKKPLVAAFPGSSQAGESTRFATRGVMGSVLGPTAGMIETATKAIGGNTNAMTQMVPYGSYPGMREFMQILTDDSPYLKR